MSFSYSSGNFSSQSLGCHLRPSFSTFHSFYPGNVTFSPRTYQLGSSIYGGDQETYYEPTSCQTSCTGTRSFQTSYYRPNNFISSSPCQTNCTGTLGFGNTGFGSFGYGNTGFQSLGCGSNFYRPTYFSNRSCQSSCFRPTCGSGFIGSTY